MEDGQTLILTSVVLHKTCNILIIMYDFLLSD